jgi:Ribosomal protein L13e
MVTRPGRGYSFGELQGAGVTTGEAHRWGVRVDSRRRSVLEANVDSLRGWRVRTPPAPKAEGEVKKVEEELEKVVKEVEEKVEKKAVKVEKEIKKEVKKAGRKAKEKVEKKPRPKKKPKT